MKIRNFFITSLIVVIVIALIFNPTKYTAVSLNGIIVWGTVLLPSLFPFIFFTRVFATFEVINYLSIKVEPITKKLFNCPGKSSYVFIMSILSGYPIGARLTADLYSEGSLNQGQAVRTASFTSNSGPMFILGSVGIGMFLSYKAGVIIYLSHIIGAIINGIIWRKYGLRNQDIISSRRTSLTNKKPIEEIVWSSISSILVIGAYVCLFFIISEIAISLKLYSPLEKLLELCGISREITHSILSGFLEITKGCQELSLSQASIKPITSVATFIITFGGIATFFQATTFLAEFKMPKSIFFAQKMTHAIVSTSLSVLICVIFL